MTYLSVIIPIHNEEANIDPLYAGLKSSLDPLGKPTEIIFVDDGSTDGSFKRLQLLAQRDTAVKIIQFTRNFGQTAALAAGIEEAAGEICVLMDGDNQNDPADIPRLLAKLDAGYDVVSGWRRDRRDPFLTRKLPSHLANWLISQVTGVHLKDYGCTLKAYRSPYLNFFKLYGEMHRFIPAYAEMAGARITEIPVTHHARTQGHSKYGLGRTFKVLLDLLTVKFLGSFATKPLYFFGSIGFFLNFAAFFCGAYVLYEKYFLAVYAHKNPLLLLAVFLSIVGIVFILMGLLAELLMRTYHESQGKHPYVVRKKINL